MRTHKLLVLIVLACSACTRTSGKDFSLPDSSQVIMGKTSQSEILAIYGKPYRQSSNTVTDTPVAPVGQVRTNFDPALVSGSFASLYFQHTQTQDPLLGGGFSGKSVVFDFWNDAVVAYKFGSSFDTDSSNFDESKVSVLKKGESTRDQVVALLGQPDGRAVYPVIQSQSDEMWIYFSNDIDVKARQTQIKQLNLLFGADGHLEDLRMSSSSQPLAVAPRPAVPFVMPIFIPHK